MNRLVVSAWLLAAAVAAQAGCKKSAGAGPADGASDSFDGSTEPMAAACPSIDGGPEDDGGPDAGTVSGVDEFGPNAPAAKTASSLGRVNIFEVTTPSQLERLDIYLQADLPHTRLTIAVQEAPSRTSPFSKLTDIQIDFGTCQGWASSGPLTIPLRVGRFYAMGFDPNQVVTSFVSTDGDSLPIDGMFGRLIGSRTATSVSVPTLTWDKFLDKEYNRQRLMTSPRVPDDLDVAPVDAGTDATKGDAAGGGGAGGVAGAGGTGGAAGSAAAGTDGGSGDVSRDSATTDGTATDTSRG